MINVFVIANHLKGASVLRSKKTNINNGHFYANDRYLSFKDISIIQAYMLDKIK
jgi:hypothetical protein